MRTHKVSVAEAAVTLSLLSLFLLSTDVNAGDRRRVRAVSPSAAAPAITFVGAETGIVDVATIVWSGEKRNATITTRVLRMRIGEPAAEAVGHATVSAFLEVVDPRCEIRINGVPLGIAPRVIRRNAPVGVVFTERIEIEVPVTAAEGPLQASIGWEVTTE